jgi:transmembrane sensor
MPGIAGHANSMTAPIDPRVLDQAADWLMQLSTGTATDAERVACEQWRRSDPEHARAWARAELLLNKLGGLPAALAMPALDRPANAGRRAALAKLAALAAVLPAGWLAWRLAGEQPWRADHRTAIGQRRNLQLADGSRVTLNTATAIDVQFDARHRLIRLRDGEILIETARDTAPQRRRFLVDTEQGRLEALGTRFTVRQEDGRTRVAVFEGAVRIEPRRASERDAFIVHAGHKTSFSDRSGATALPVDESAAAWTQGMLLADKMRAADFTAELSRYRDGIVHCDPAIADLRISGAFPIADTERALAMLVSTYPVAVKTRLRGYWVTLTPR